MAERLPFNFPDGFFASKEEEEEVLRSIHFPQDEEERREIRERYKNFQNELLENRHEMVNPADAHDLLTEKVVKVDTLFKPVKMPREGALDSISLLKISELGKIKAQALKTDFVSFSPTDFCDKVGILMCGDDRENNCMSHSKWVALGNAVQPFFRRTPVLKFMCGSFERGDVILKRLRCTRERERDGPSDMKSVRPTQLTSFEETDRGELTTAQVEYLLDTLWKIYKKEEGPICFFEFVTNPDSFGHTVENIFYASFLVRDGYARIYLDEEQLPVIEPIDRKEGDTGEPVQNQQVIITITLEEWKAILEAFHIENAVIKPNRQHDVLRLNGMSSNTVEDTVSNQQGKGKGKKTAK